MNMQCSIALLESALAGNLPAEDEGSLHRHLEECEQCCAALERMAGGAAWSQEAAALLTKDELDAAAPTRDEWSAVDFTVEHLDPSDEPGVLGRLGGYDVLEIIGHGGMGVVLKAFDRELKRCVAIKVLTPHLAQSPLAKKRFAREAQAAAAVVHPNVLAIHQVQPGGRLPFLVMPLVAGESLAQRLAVQGRLELKEMLRIGMQAAAGLAAAHEQGLVHRDVKPANILLEMGVERAVLTDFGLARAADDVTLTRWGVIAGTPQYMSPEQARGEPLDGRSDLFSLGCVLYEMATGVSPFRADSMLATMRRLVDDPPQAIASLNPELPPWFVAIVDRLLEKDPARRFGSAKEVSELLEGCLAHVQQPSSVPLPAALPKPARRRAWKPPTIYWKGTLAMIATLGAGLLGLFLLSAEPPDIAGQWTGEDWGQVVLRKDSATEYTGTYSATVGKAPGEIRLRWSRVERRFNGTWREGEDRFGELSVRLVGDEIRGALTTDPKSKINPATPRLADLTWMRAVAAQNAPFGPVIERTVNDLDDGQGNESLSLRTGKLISLPAGFGSSTWTEQARQDWLSKNSVDLLADFARNRWALICRGVKFGDLANEQWERVTPADVHAALAAGCRRLEVRTAQSGSICLLPSTPQPPLTFAVQTAAGDRGILQFTGLTDKPRGLKIRYKLVQAGATNATAVPNADRDVPWGDWNLSWSVRLRAAKTVWSVDELPQFTVDLRKRDETEPDALWQTLHDWQLEVDGRRFRLGIVSTAWEHKQVIEPGMKREGFIAFHLYRDERGLHVRTGEAGQWINSYELRPIGKDGQVMDQPKPEERFQWTPGKHVVRIAFPVTPDVPPGEADKFRAISNPVEVRVEGKVKAAFGPVVEQSLEMPEVNAMAPVWLDLDRGKTIPVADFHGDKDRSGDFPAWLRKQGADVCALSVFPDAMSDGRPLVGGKEEARFAERGLGTIAGLGLLTMPVKAGLWDAADADSVLSLNAALALQTDADKARKLVPLGQTLANPKGQLPATFVFRTAEGNTGILQITDLSDKPRGVKICYKLVQTAARVPATDWAPVSPQRVRRLSADVRVGTIACSPDGKLIAVGNDQPTMIMMQAAPSKVADNWQPVVEVLDATTGKPVTTLKLLGKEEESLFAETKREPYFQVKALAFSPDGKLLAVGTSVGQVKLFDARTGNLVRSLDDAEGKKADGKTAKKFLPLTRALGGVSSLAFSPDGRSLAVCGGSFADVPLISDDRMTRTGLTSTAPGRLKLWDVETGSLKHDLIGYAHAEAAAFSPDGTRLAGVGSWNAHGANSPSGSGVKIWDTASGEMKSVIATSNNAHPWSVAFSPDGKLVAIGTQKFGKASDSSTGAVTLAHVASGVVEWLYSVPGWVRTVAFSRDGESVVALSSKSAVQFLDTATGKQQNAVRRKDSPKPESWNVISVAPQTNLLVIGGSDGERRGFVELWNMDVAPVQDKVTGEAQSTQSPTFGPVMERVLPSGVPCREQYFQFRSGKTFIVGNGPDTTKEQHDKAWKQAEDAGGVDMTAGCGDEGIQLVGRGCVFTRDVGDLKWDTCTAKNAVDVMKHASFSYGVVEPLKKQLPITYLFRTSRGDLGIMEILDVVEDERGFHGEGEKGRGMKFRYKLVQSDAAKTAAEKDVPLELLRVQLRQAEEALPLLEARAKAGRCDEATLQAAKDSLEILKAQIGGDAVQVARLRLAAAEHHLKMAEAKYQMGVVDAAEYQVAKNAVELRQAELRSKSAHTPAKAATP